MKRLVAVGTAVALLTALALGSAALAQEPEVLTFEAVGDSGISGTATLTQVDGDVEVVVEATGLVTGNMYASGAYDSTSVTCTGGLISSFNEFDYADGGVTYTVAGVSLSDIFSVSVRDITESGSPPGTVVACAERADIVVGEPLEEEETAPVEEEEAVAPPVSGVGPLDDSSVTVGLAVLLAGALTVLGLTSFGLAFATRRIRR